MGVDDPNYNDTNCGPAMAGYVTSDEKEIERLEKRVKELKVDLANSEAKARNKDVEISNLRYHLDTMRGKVPKRPWRWVKKFQMGHRRNHWCLESVPEPDNGVGDGHGRTVGIILTDYWSEHPNELMLFMQQELNLSAERQAENMNLRELVGLADSGRCIKCGWPLEDSPDKGCVPGNCSYRPHDGTVEHDVWTKRSSLVTKVREFTDLAKQN